MIDAETDGKGVHLVLDGVGDETTDRSVDVLAPFGRMVSYGTASGEPGRPSTEKLLFCNAQVLGFHLAQTLQRSPRRVLDGVPDLKAMLADGRLDVHVDHRFSLADATVAHEYIENRKSKGKIVLSP